MSEKYSIADTEVCPSGPGHELFCLQCFMSPCPLLGIYGPTAVPKLEMRS